MKLMATLNENDMLSEESQEGEDKMDGREPEGANSIEFNPKQYYWIFNPELKFS